MFRRVVSTFEQWRGAARTLLIARIPPEEIEWCREGLAEDPSPASAPALAAAVAGPSPRMAASVLQLLSTLSLYRTDGRWELMYRLAWRIANGRPLLLDDAADPDVRHASLMQRAVNRDVHKMHAYVRFRETTGGTSGAGDTPGYFAWFEPQHEILRRAAEFFVRRFPNMQWTIATPDGAAVWKLHELCFVDPPALSDRPRRDGCEDLWRTYYRSICNAARINPAAMQREMPRRYWRHLPEAAEIDPLIRDGAANFIKLQRESPEETMPLPKAVKRALPAPPPALDENPQSCRRCEIWRQATQAVPGEGAAHAPLMLVGEQPGDEEDLRGRPFVGPAGKVLDQVIAAAGLERGTMYVTNAVKHFKWEPRGKRRLHQKPAIGEIRACNIWLEQEITAEQPQVIVALGATALRALTGAALTIDAARRQELQHPGGARILATYHPSAILRAEGERVALLTGLLEADLRRAAALIANASSSVPPPSMGP